MIVCKNEKCNEVQSLSTPLQFVTYLCSTVDIGADNEDKHPRHLNTSDEIMRHYSRMFWDMPSHLRVRWSNKRLHQHCSGERLHYFAGGKNRFSLLMIDVDCKTRGTLEGALSYCQHLRDEFLPDLYFEPSRGGKGANGIVVLDSEKMTSEGLKPVMKRLASWLNHVAEGFDVEKIEVKGTKPHFVWDDGKYNLKRYTSGVLARLPMGLFNRFSELKNTTVITVDEIRRLHVPEAKKQPKKAVKVARGSGGTITQDEDLAGLSEGGVFRLAAEAVLELGDIQTTSNQRQKITVDDIAIFVMLLSVFSRNMNKDGTMPRARWQGEWTRLSSEGSIVRGWCPNRFTAIRDWFSDNGFIDWADNSYVVGNQALGISGRATKWEASAKFWSLLSSLRGVITSCVEQENPGDSAVLRGEITSCVEHHFRDNQDNPIIRPYMVIPLVVPDYSPDELTEYVGCLAA